jgi:hypothetical protein
MNDKVKKLLMSIAALGALAAGGAAYASAQGSPTPTTTPAPATAESETGTAADPADTNEGAEKPDANEGPETADKQDGAEANDKVTGDAATKAKDAALAAEPGGKVGDISAEQPDSGKAAADTPEPGDTPDPAYQSKIAYDVEVTKTDGSAVTVHLDKAFAVLGTTKEDAGGPDGENAQG